MLVTQSNFDKALKEICLAVKSTPFLGFDTETTCVPWWDHPFYAKAGIVPRVFSMQFATNDKEYYFDFNHSADKLGDKHFAAIHRELTSNPDITWYVHNAKFDLHHCANHDVHFCGDVFCTSAMARVVSNDEVSLQLDALAEKYLGVGKLDVIPLLKERGHLTKVKKFGDNDKYDECLHFDRLELSELVSYGMRDTRLCFDLGVFQTKKIQEIDEEIYSKLPAQHDGRRIKLSDVAENEKKLTKVLFKMEREGVLIDRKYTQAAYSHEVAEYHRIEGELDTIGSKYGSSKKVDWNSAKQLKPIFDAANEPYSYTSKGNASFDQDALADSESELAKLILDYRYHYKRAHTYFENFLWFADSRDVLHATAQQGGTQYGRMSYWEPNLQNVPKRTDKDETQYKVRRCFIPKPGKVLMDIDYKGAEYTVAMDYAREMTIVEELKSGIDPHKRLGVEMGLSRDDAKTTQFLILYGGGAKALGRALGYKGLEAERIGKAKKKLYFERVPALDHVIRQVCGGWYNGQRIIGVAESRGYIFNWLGRLLKYSKDTAYKAFNGLIQGGVGDATKVAMVRIDPLLEGKETKMLIQVHDSIVFELALAELDLVPKIREIMTQAYPHKVISLGTDVSYSKVSWADLSASI